MFRKYPKPKNLWSWEEVFIVLFLLTISLQAVGHMGEGLTFAKFALFFGFPIFFVRALLRKDMWLFLLPFKSWTSLALLALFLANVLSGFNQLHNDYFGGILSRFLMLYVTVFFMAAVIKNKKRVLYIFLAAFIIGSIPNGLAGIYELVTGKQVLKYVIQGTAASQKLMGGRTQQGSDVVGSRRVLGFDGGAGEHAMHFVVFSGLSAMLPLMTKNPFLKGIFLLTLFFNLVNVAGTGSRTGMIGLSIAYVVFLLFIEMRRKWIILLFTFILGVAAVWIFDLPLTRLLGWKGTVMTRHTVDFRMEQYKTAFNMWDKHKFLGIGMGSFTFDYPAYLWNYPQHDKWYSVGPLHNSFLNQLAEGGLVGLFFLLLLLFVVICKLYRIRKDSNNYVNRTLAVGFLTAFLGWVGGMLFYPSFFDEQGWIMMGLIIGLWNVHEKEMRTSVTNEPPTG